MESILYNVSQVLGLSIIHSLWQGMLVYFVLRIVFAGAPSLSSVKRYNLAIFAMLSVTACFFYTLFAEIQTYNWVSVRPVHPGSLLPLGGLPANSPFAPGFYARVSEYMPYICALYFAGLLANMVKLGWEWNKIRRIKQALICAEQMQQFINSFSKKLNITKHIQLKFSEMVDVPCVIGCLKPLILLPVSLSVHLSACEIEAILLHELSHIKRNDYLVNLLQQALSVMLFFNPFILLINRVINSERENSCDDLVVEKTGKPLIYAKALLKLEEARAHDLQLALAVTGKRFHLLTRIERIMKTQKQIGNVRHLLIAILLFAGAAGSIAWFNPSYGKITPLKVSGSATPVNVTGALPTDSNQNVPISDTVKHKHKGKTTAKNSTGYKKHTYSQKELSPAEKKEFFKKHPDFDSTSFDSMAKLYNSPEWRTQMEAMRKQGEEMRKKFNSPEWKNEMLAMRKQGEEMRKKFDSPEWKAEMENMKKQGEEMRKKFDSPEWKAEMENMKKQGEEMRKKFDSPEWKAEMENMKKQGEEMRKKFDSPEWKAEMENMKKQGEMMRKKFNSPEWKHQMENMKKQGELMRKKFNSPEWKAEMELMKKQGELWNKTMKDQKWILKDSVGGAKTDAPEKDTVKN